jgi:hypothetical protein
MPHSGQVEVTAQLLQANSMQLAYMPDEGSEGEGVEL